MEEVPSTSAEQVNGDDVDAEAKRLMGAGSRHLVMKDVRSAVNAFQEASSLLGKKYGETADECADAFYYYGMALLELARMENTVLGNALEGMPEDEDEECEKEDPNIPSASNLDEKEREELREQVYDAMAEKAENQDSKEAQESKADEMESEKSPDALQTQEKAENQAVEKVTEAAASLDEEKSTGEADSTQGPEEKPQEGPEEKPQEGEGPEAAARAHETAEEKEDKTSDEAEPMEGEEEDGAESDENEEMEEKESEEEEVGNLQLAWEVLELSKIIFTRRQDKESQLLAAQAHLKLGEVSIESENYTQAVEDFLSCLIIQKKHLEEHDRLLAETHYQLGLAYHYSSRHDDAVSHFTQSTDVIEKRLAVLTEQLDTATDKAKEGLQKEMDELKGLLPDIKEKIEDSKEAQKTAEDTDKALRETLGGTSGFTKENGHSSCTVSSRKLLVESESAVTEQPLSSQAAAEKSDSATPGTNTVSDISHLVRKKVNLSCTANVGGPPSGDCRPVVSRLLSFIPQRKPEDGSPLKEAKRAKSEPVENGSGSGDAVVPTNEEAKVGTVLPCARWVPTTGVPPNRPFFLQAETQTPMEMAAVESTA
ncbi:histone exchange [Pristimantis euphronides]